MWCSAAMLELDMAAVRRVVALALEEDGARNDVTTQALVSPGQQGRGVFLAKAAGVICGLPVAAAAFAELDPAVRFEALVAEGAISAPGSVLARVEGPLSPILSAERVALNLVQRLSGVATATRALVDAVSDLPVKILDTRKTMPGLRSLERYAVACGGGTNHRFNLSDALLIKDNHLAAARLRRQSLTDVVSRARAAAPVGMKVELEVTNVDEAGEALEAGVQALLLDNMSLDDMRCVADHASGRATLEASGNVTLQNVRQIAETGVDYVSVGWITHSAPALDISLKLEVG
jgi:nicotinate-nucleotide pyrophosphorylase (carboxylating)